MSDMHPQGEAPRGRSAHSGHEGTDLSLKPIIGFVLFLVALGVAVHFTLGVFMRRFEADSAALKAMRPPLYGDKDGQYPPPNTPDNPRADLATHRARERKILDSYGWEKPDAGIARVPVDRAIEILAERGLPKVKNIAPKGARGGEKP
jgi:hypothetical protein